MLAASWKHREAFLTYCHGPYIRLWALSGPMMLQSGVQNCLLLQWARAVCPIKLLQPSDPVFDWRDRMFERYHDCIFATRGYDYK